MLYIGVDNGSSGAIAALIADGQVFRVDKMPPTDAEVYALLMAVSHGIVGGKAVAALEHAQAFPRMGGCSAFTYGKGYGATQMALHVAGIPFDIITPAKWQAKMQCLSKGDKNVTKRRAEQLFPSVKITHAIADALLIAEYCRRIKLGI